jgi:hypothetical protein
MLSGVKVSSHVLHLPVALQILLLLLLLLRSPAALADSASGASAAVAVCGPPQPASLLGLQLQQDPGHAPGSPRQTMQHATVSTCGTCGPSKQ